MCPYQKERDNRARPRNNVFNPTTVDHIGRLRDMLPENPVNDDANNQGKDRPRPSSMQYLDVHAFCPFRQLRRLGGSGSIAVWRLLNILFLLFLFFFFASLL